ncbi:MAG: hypothetical protein N2560_00100 [Ignavibacteria bacterium]|nr:hypothetical protein [Ignavibacteria bacterium]
MKRKFILIVIVFITLSLQFCTQPSELDDPVVAKPTDRMKARIYPQIYYISIGENGVVNEQFTNVEKGAFEPRKAEISVDTLSQTPLVWFKLNLERKHFEYQEKGSRRLTIKSINFNIDSFPIVGFPLPFRTFESPKSWIKVNLARGPKKDFDTIVDPTIKPNYFEIGFNYNKRFREIWALGYGKIYNTRYALTKRDTTVIDSILKTRYDTIWIDNKPYVKKVDYWEVKVIKLQIEEITPFPDSLLLNFKIRLKY